MNYLAHIYLSGNDEQVIVGNFIGDYVKGRDYDNFPIQVRKGILLHRQIDSFTDSHPITRKHKTYLYSQYHKHAGIVTDIFYDHFLAKEWTAFSDEKFHDYTNRINNILVSHVELIPPGLQVILPNFVKNKWLQSYESINSIKGVLIGMSKGSSMPDEADYAIHILKKHYREMTDDFHEYFPQIIAHVKSEAEKIA